MRRISHPSFLLFATLCLVARTKNNIINIPGSIYLYKVVAAIMCSLNAEVADVPTLEARLEAASFRSPESPEVRLANSSV